MTKKSGEDKAPWLEIGQVREHLPIERVLEHYGLQDQLTLEGGTAVGLSPFHDGSMRSFRVELGRNLWNDFAGRPEGCAGHSVGLVQALEGCSFRRALEISAELAGLANVSRSEASAVLGEDEPSGQGGRDGPSSHPDPSSIDESPERSASRIAPSERPAASQDATMAEAETEKASPPFGKQLRGLRSDAPLLQALGVPENVAKAYGVGMAVRGLMKGLLAFPVHVPGQDVIAGYVGRAVTKRDGQLLWKNPPGFPRSEHLFGLHRARETQAGRASVEKHGLVVVQSPLSVLKLAACGLSNGVALMDPEVSATQVDLLTRADLNPSRKLTLLLNADERGQQGKRQAARRLIHRAYVRYVAWEVLSEPTRSPKDLTGEQLRQLLAHQPSSI